MSTEPRSTSSRLGAVLIPIFFLIGSCARLVPLFDPGGRLLRQFPTEDGYLMLTIARNLALGHGMSTAEGTLPTNGTQPLATFLWAICYRLVGGDKTEGVRAVLGLELGLAALTAWLIFRFSERVFAGQRQARLLALLAASVWYASPVVLPHTMNCLESGLYVCVIAATLAYAARALARPSDGPRIGAFLGLGGLLGIAFWARNDAVLFCVALGITHLVGIFPGGTKALRDRFWEMGCAGVVVATLALPWLVFNFKHFGSIMPISGQAESLHAKLGENLSAVPVNAFEYLTLMLPVPRSFDSRPWVIAVTSFVLVGGLALLLARGRRWADLRFAVLIFVVVVLALFAAFYGLFFGAGHFMSRYLIVLSPFSALLWPALLLRLDATPRRWCGWAALVALPGAVVLATLLNLRAYRLGAQHQHFQVVEWVQQNVPDAVWIGAVQSGTLGYFHDRTLNLDGKVNPEALAAHKSDAILQYTVASKAEYLVDWIGITSWLEPPVSEAFGLVLSSPEQNLAVLGRKSKAERGPR